MKRHSKVTRRLSIKDVEAWTEDMVYIGRGCSHREIGKVGLGNPLPNGGAPREEGGAGAVREVPPAIG